MDARSRSEVYRDREPRQAPRLTFFEHRLSLATPNRPDITFAAMHPDGLRAMVRYAGLEVLEGRTQWEDLEQYDSESNKWHDSVLLARKTNSEREGS